MSLICFSLQSCLLFLTLFTFFNCCDFCFSLERSHRQRCYNLYKQMVITINHVSCVANRVLPLLLPISPCYIANTANRGEIKALFVVPEYSFQEKLHEKHIIVLIRRQCLECLSELCLTLWCIIFSLRYYASVLMNFLLFLRIN